MCRKTVIVVEKERRKIELSLYHVRMWVRVQSSMSTLLPDHGTDSTVVCANSSWSILPSQGGWHACRDLCACVVLTQHYRTDPFNLHVPMPD
jgi:hypothetical protein